jgi:DnaJ-class molecular chaperone
MKTRPLKTRPCEDCGGTGQQDVRGRWGRIGMSWRKKDCPECDGTGYFYVCVECGADDVDCECRSDDSHLPPEWLAELLCGE